MAPERSGNDVDFSTYVSFLSNLRNALGSGGHRYGLSITLPCMISTSHPRGFPKYADVPIASYWYMRNFDIVKLQPLVDWFNVMTYDLHGTWDSTDPYIGAVVNSHTNLTEIDQVRAAISSKIRFLFLAYSVYYRRCNCFGVITLIQRKSQWAWGKFRG